MNQIEALHQKFKQMLQATKELKDLSNQKGLSPHTVIHNLIDIDTISEASVQDKESIINMYNLAEDKRKELIEMLNRFDPSLVV